MTEWELTRNAPRRLAIIRHAQEVTGKTFAQSRGETLDANRVSEGFGPGCVRASTGANSFS